MTKRRIARLDLIDAKELVLSDEPMRHAILAATTAGGAPIELHLSETALAKIEAMLDVARAEEAKRRPTN